MLSSSSLLLKLRSCSLNSCGERRTEGKEKVKVCGKGVEMHERCNCSLGAEQKGKGLHGGQSANLREVRLECSSAADKAAMAFVFACSILNNRPFFSMGHKLLSSKLSGEVQVFTGR